ncbi:MAG: hypothetical protein E7673_06775 [Ruminococcaceae bacterium]|nr:hypothetical protein [Oscillospiraceae bacterium]
MKIKSLSLLVLLALCLTIGGVYATWSYAGTNDIADAYAEAKVTITDAVLTGANGTYHIESNLVLYVDQNPANNNHESLLLFESNNSQPIYLKVTFTPATNAPQTIKDNAVPSELYFTTTVPMQYKMDAQGNYSETGTPVDIFTFTNPGNGELDEVFSWHKEDDGTFTYELDEADLRAQIALSQVFVLDTKVEHDAFRAALGGNIVARVTDGTVNQNGTTTQGN